MSVGKFPLSFVNLMKKIRPFLTVVVTLTTQNIYIYFLFILILIINFLI
jgi:hypothetical protein